MWRFLIPVFMGAILFSAAPGFGENRAAPAGSTAVGGAAGSAEEDPYLDPFEGKSLESQKKTALSDPWEKLNRKIYGFNDFFYFNMLKPASRGYKTVVPRFVRKSVRNFFTNILEPVYFLNSVLQRKPKDAQAAFRRFLVNSTVGVGGLFDPAKKPAEPMKRSFDQTFAKWGARPGFYIVWPLAGSSSFLRGTFGLVGEKAMDPFNYGGTGVAAGSSVLESVNETSFQIGAYEDVKKYSVDSYSALKDIYEKQIYKKSRE